ncbi:MFS transporter [Leifsonia sp. 21MFCrub1.1]|uniref:MFS transporter n=1 Tax=Leifsonia sp. 21MFCrub1.1 TaxID=1798223 RepID=UPI0008928C36|nr:MFS transporter [Leifsonia sp. 21MFCrub1.1]SEA80056.1 Major Facilitator Superfamily protein [Leifsonia sp. 21MFCrub1.1]
MALTLSPLRNRRFRRLLCAQAFPWLTANGATIAVVFAVLDGSDGAVGAGLVLAARALPALLLGLVGGVIADRWSRRTVAAVCAAGMAVAQSAVAALIWTGGTGMLIPLLLVVFAAGSAQSLGASALFAMPRECLRDDELAPAQGILRSLRNALGIIGPAIAGIVIASGGTIGILLADACASVLSAILLASLPARATAGPPGPQNAGRPSAIAQLAHGWHAFVGRRWLVISVAAFGAAMFAWSGGYAVLGPLSLRRLDDAAGVWGLIAAGLAGGYVTGSVLAITYRPSRPVSWSLSWQAASALPLVLLAADAEPFLLVISALIAGFGLEQAGAVWAAAMQEHVPPEELGRVSSYDYVASFGLVPFGYALAAPFAELVSAPVALGAAALLIAAPCIAAALSPSTRAVRHGSAELTRAS